MIVHLIVIDLMLVSVVRPLQLQSSTFESYFIMPLLRAGLTTVVVAFRGRSFVRPSGVSGVDGLCVSGKIYHVVEENHFEEFSD